MTSRLPLLLAALMGAALICQFPEFYQQYLQQLAGRLDQADARVQEIRSDARSLGLGPEAYIGKFLESDTHALEGARMRDSFADARELRGALAELRGASAFAQPLRFTARLDPAVASSTLALYKPAVPLSAAGLAYALAGAFMGILIAGLLLQGARRLLNFLYRENVET